MKEAYIRFLAPVVPQTADALFRIVDKKLRENVERLHLLLSSPGGSVFHGISAYSFLKGCPMEIYTYNFGSVDSIGVVIFCAGDRRFSVPHARFLIHGVSVNFQGNHMLDEKGLEEKLKGLKIDYQNIARVISDTTEKPAHKVQDDMNNRITLSATEARDYGLVHEIKIDLLPAGADLSVVGDSGLQHQQQTQQIQIPIPIQIPPPAAQHGVPGEHVKHMT
jgi:ATP-dependent protease ClpP protease subunit